MRYLIFIVTFVFLGCGTTQAKQRAVNSDETFTLKDSDLVQPQEEIDKYDLGSRENPVRVSSTKGEYEYLAKLRCKDGSKLTYFRAGSVGVGPYGYTLDLYIASCSTGENLIEYKIFMDLYHPEYSEKKAIFDLKIIE